MLYAIIVLLEEKLGVKTKRGMGSFGRIQRSEYKLRRMTPFSLDSERNR